MRPPWGQGKLVRVYQKDGRQFGVLETQLKLPARHLEGLPIDPPGTIEVRAVHDGAIDGSSTAASVTQSLKATGRAKRQRDGVTFLVDVRTEFSATEERSAETPATTADGSRP